MKNIALPTFGPVFKSVLAATLCSATLAVAAGYPDKPITIVVPYAAGGSNDLVARVIGNQIGKELNVAVVVDNAAGASGTIGAAKVVNARPDGYTLLLGSNSEVSIAKLMNPAVRYDGQRDLSPVRMIGSQPMVLVTGSQSSIRGIDGFLSLAKDKQNVNYGTSGVGTPLHLTGELIRSMTRINMNHVPYKGGASAVTDLIGNQIDLGVLVLSTALPYIKSGKLQAIGVTSATRSPAAPDIAALAESKSLAGVNMRLWFGIFAPKNVPDDVNDTLLAALNRAVAAPEVTRKLAESGVELDTRAGAAFGAFIADETKTYRKIVAETNVQK
jgi:tripartite-type tricarboxylate transporter receptor subunit TctC